VPVLGCPIDILPDLGRKKKLAATIPKILSKKDFWPKTSFFGLF
jgi:hypothetical protein